MYGGLFLILVVFFVAGCRTHPATEFKTVTNTIVREVPVQVTDTITITIAADTVWQVATDSSELSNEWCKSRAWIRKDGTLYHDLTTIAQERQQEATYRYIRQDSIITTTHTKTIYKDKSLTWWQRIKQKYATSAIAVLLLLLLVQYGWHRRRTP
jgi:hypothetical protein